MGVGGLLPSGKVMFLHLSASHSVDGGEVSTSVHAGMHTPLGRHPLLADTALGRHPPGRHPPQQTASEADGTHPTGMLSCLLTFLSEGTITTDADLRGSLGTRVHGRYNFFHFNFMQFSEKNC